MMTLQNCKKCKVYEKRDPKVPLCTIATMEPMDLVHIDLVGMEVTIKTKKKPVVQKILVVTDHFSRFVQDYKVKDKREQSPLQSACTTTISDTTGFPSAYCLTRGPSSVMPS